MINHCQLIYGNKFLALMSLYGIEEEEEEEGNRSGQRVDSTSVLQAVPEIASEMGLLG